MKITTLFAFSVLATGAHASFELVMGVDFVNGSIRRWDGDTGTKLGSFGAGHLVQPSGIAINQALGRAYVYDRANFNIFTFNYSTGEYIGNFSTAGKYYGWISTTSAGDILLGSTDGGGGTFMGRYNPNGTLLNIYNPYGGQSSYSLCQGADGGIYTIDGAGTFSLRYNLGGGGYTNYNGASTFFSANGGEMRSRGSEVWFATGTSRNIKSMAGNSGMATGTTLDFSPQFSSEVVGLGFGHGNNMYVSGLNSTGGRLLRYNMVSGKRTILDDVAGSNISSLAVVAAPEPGSIAALGLGLIAIAGRKRRK